MNLMDERELKMPSKLACEIERKHASSLLIGPARRLGCIVDESLSPLIEERNDLLKALARICAPLDCGCSPCTGQCRSQEALEITVDVIRCIATEAIIAATSEAPCSTQ